MLMWAAARHVFVRRRTAEKQHVGGLGVLQAWPSGAAAGNCRQNPCGWESVRDVDVFIL
jgi:hypothetical protein